MRYVLIGIGSVSAVLGTIGVFVPLLPTTPFLLLACACYAKSSKRLHAWLLANRLFGKYISDYTERRGMALRAKVVALVSLWVVIGLNAALATDQLAVRIALLVIAAAVTVHILMLRTLTQ